MNQPPAPTADAVRELVRTLLGQPADTDAGPDVRPVAEGGGSDGDGEREDCGGAPHARDLSAGEDRGGVSHA
ncbi:hypothetical protein [Streptomyces sp. NPDC046985]|uniref:hypothetical protein n=1 Tax=Streptomyces sp. NPDC046985 TaxID=3155377 RepID=UPI0033D058A4